MPNSQLHFGVFIGEQLEGVMQFGPSMDKRKIQGLVRDTSWNDFLELNRMAFSDRLPRNSESRALSVAFRLIRKNYPNIQWVVSFSDGTQSGDGTIYRAAGFVLTSIKKNSTLWGNDQGDTIANNSVHSASPQRRQAIINRVTMTDVRCGDARRDVISRMAMTKGAQIMEDGSASMKAFKDAGYAPLPGFQLRYIYFLDPAARARLTVPEIPFARIAEMGAGMYRGQARGKQAMTGDQPEQRRGSTDRHAPTPEPKTKKARK